MGGVNATLRTLAPPRPGGPLAVEVRISSFGGAREGRLRIDLLVSEDPAGVWEGPDWRISQDISTFRVLLPPPRDWAPGYELAAIAHWVGDGEVPLGRFPLRLSSTSPGAGSDAQRIVALVAPQGREEDLAGIGIPAMVRDEDHLPQPQLVAAARLEAGSAPISAIGWCSYDAVVLHPEAVLPPSAVTALADWMLAGGRVLIAAGRSGPAAQELQAAAKRAAIASGSGSGGTAAGLGLLVTMATADDRSAATTALWAGLSSKPQDSESIRYGYNYGYRDDNGSLLALLWPETVGQVPLTLVLVVFVGFLVWIGPLEWWLLGRIRRRRWTWITFPLAAAIATIAVAAVARQALGSSDHVRRLVVVDCDQAGVPRLVRSLELRFAGGDHELVEHPHGELLVPISSSQGRPYGYQGYGREQASVPLSAVHRGPWHDGGEVSIRLPQWTPVLAMRLACAPDPARLGTPPGWQPGDGEQAISQAFHAGFAVGCLWVGRAETVFGDRTALDSKAPSRDSYRDEGPRQGVGFQQLRSLLTGSQRGLRPGGAPSAALDDLHSDADAVIVARRDGEDFIVWRRPLAPKNRATHVEKP